MSDLAIRVEGLSKLYHIGASQARYKTLRESLVEAVKAPLMKVLKPKSAESNPNTIWALDNVSFDVRQGEVVGVIGRNGAGKSTLLKVLSHITGPTRGRVRLHGRVGSLLEVGTGFHPELTGRENVFLNGAILGMRRTEIARKFDEIVEFAEVERFLDTPVKHYSSGMYVRLAFSVAAHLETEILLVDEVLAVGDTEFQKKCLGQMEKVSKDGRTVIFVSHNMSAIKNICRRALLLKKGGLIDDGLPNTVIENYLTANSTGEKTFYNDLTCFNRTMGSQEIALTSVMAVDSRGQPTYEFSVWEPINFRISLAAKADYENKVSLWMMIYSMDGTPVMTSLQADVMEPFTVNNVERTVRVRVENCNLVPGEYSVSLGLLGKQREISDWVDNAISIMIRSEFIDTRPFDDRMGLTTVKSTWIME